MWSADDSGIYLEAARRTGPGPPLNGVRATLFSRFVISSYRNRDGCDDQLHIRKASLGAQTKALVIAEAVTLAHVGRSIRLASILHREGIDVELACDSRYGRFL